ncbi:very short patch repair endonuclease, partial [Candidatus Shapirobacteria bacterium CG_4_10_14_0_2_um_filter_40_12]
MDNLTREQRKLCMTKIKAKNTKPEIVVRKILSKLG